MLDGGQPSAQPRASARDGLGQFQPAACSFGLASPGQGALESSAARGLASVRSRAAGRAGATPSWDPGEPEGPGSSLEEKPVVLPSPGGNLHSQLLGQVQHRRSGLRCQELGLQGGGGLLLAVPTGGRLLPNPCPLGTGLAPFTGYRQPDGQTPEGHTCL